MNYNSKIKTGPDNIQTKNKIMRRKVADEGCAFHGDCQNQLPPSQLSFRVAADGERRRRLL